jgi:hypothetical protein
MAYRFDQLPALSGAARAEFDKQGFLIVERLLHDAQIEALRATFPRIFAGKFDTGVYPDEWYWREGMSLPDVTRHMANAWKSHPAWTGHDLVEGAAHQADRAAPGHVVPRLHRSAVEHHLLGHAR